MTHFETLILTFGMYVIKSHEHKYVSLDDTHIAHAYNHACTCFWIPEFLYFFSDCGIHVTGSCHMNDNFNKSIPEQTLRERHLPFIHIHGLESLLKV